MPAFSSDSRNQTTHAISISKPCYLGTTAVGVLQCSNCHCHFNFIILTDAVGARLALRSCILLSYRPPQTSIRANLGFSAARTTAQSGSCAHLQGGVRPWPLQTRCTRPAETATWRWCAGSSKRRRLTRLTLWAERRFIAQAAKVTRPVTHSTSHNLVFQQHLEKTTHGLSRFPHAGGSTAAARTRSRDRARRQQRRHGSLHC